MRTAPEKKFLLVIELSGRPHYWMELGRGNTPDIWKARKFGERQAGELCGKEPLLKMIPA